MVRAALPGPQRQGQDLRDGGALHDAPQGAPLQRRRDRRAM